MTIRKIVAWCAVTSLALGLGACSAQDEGAAEGGGASQPGTQQSAQPQTTPEDSQGDSAAPSESAPADFDWGQHVDSQEFQRAIDAGFTIIDVRTPGEFNDRSIPGAVNLPISDRYFEDKIKELDPAGNYALYCRSGGRSRGALEIMRKHGYQHVIGLDGGLNQWPGAVK